MGGQDFLWWCDPNHGWKKWAFWEAPCWGMLVFGGKFENLEGNCTFYVHKNTQIVENLAP